MTDAVWSGASSGDWGVASFWSPSVVPNNNTTTVYDASIANSGVYTVTIAASEAFTAGSVSMSANGATLALKGQLTLSGSTSAVNVTAGTLQLSGTLSGGSLNVNGGLLLAAGNVAYAGAYAQTGSQLKLNTRTLTLSGSAQFTGNADVDGQGTLATSGGTTVVDQGNNYSAALTLGAAVKWTNSGTVNDGGLINVGDGSGLTAAFINNAGANFNFTSDDASIVNANVSGNKGSSTFANQGTLAKTGGTGTSHIWSALTSTGNINVATGTLEIDAGGNFSGKLTGNGVLAFAGGTSNMLAATTLTVQNLLIDGGTVNLSSGVTNYAGVATMISGVMKLGANLTLSGNYVQSGGNLSLNNRTLTLSGNDFFGTNDNNYRNTDAVFVDGAGTLATAGVMTLKDIGNYGGSGNPVHQLTLGGGVAWVNSGIVYIGDGIAVGDAAGGTASITNNTGGVMNFTTDDGSIVNANYYNNNNWVYGSSALTNAGLIEKTGGLGVSHVWSKVTDTGTIKVLTGTLEFDGGGSFAGPITGNGVVNFAGGAVSLKSASSFNIGHLQFTGATVALASNFASYAGSFEESGGSITLGTRLTLSGAFTQKQGVINLNGFGLVLNGAATLGYGPNYYSNTAGGTIDGSGSLTSNGAVTIQDPYFAGLNSTTQLALGGGMTWTNYGTVNDGGSISIGDASGVVATINNGGTFNFSSDDGAIVNASWQGANGTMTGVATFNNTGTLAKTRGTGVNTVQAVVNSSKLISVTTGMIEFTGGGKFNGAFSGAGTIGFGGGVSTVSLSAMTVGQVLINGGTVNLKAPSSTYAGALTENSGILALQGNLAAFGGVKLTGGGIELNGMTLTLASATTIGNLGGVYNSWPVTTIDGSGNLTTKSTTTILDPTFYYYGIQGYGNQQLVLGGGLTWTNSGVVNDGGIIAIGDAAGGSASIVNAAGASFNLTSDAAAINNNSFSQSGGQTAVGNSTFTNNGVLAKTGGTGSSYIWSQMDGAGQIQVQTGAIQFGGGGDFAGAITGAGTAAFLGGSATLDNGKGLTVANLLFDGANVSLPSDFTTYSGAISQTAGNVTYNANLVDGGAFALSGGAISLFGNLTLNGAVDFGTFRSTPYNPPSGGEIDGPGVLTTTGATTISDPVYYSNGWPQNGGVGELTLGGDVTWVNAGTVNDGGAIYVGDNAGLDATLQNNAGAVFNFTTDEGSIYNANTGANQLGQGSFINQGLLEKTGGDSVSQFSAALDDSGTITVATGTINFTNGGDFKGSVNGAGTIEFGNGAAVIDSGASFTIGQILLSGGTLEAATNLTYAGVYDQIGGELTIDDGVTLSLNNYAYLSGGAVDGAGAISVGGQLTLAGVTLGNSAETVTSSGSIVGSGVIGPAVANKGLIEATGGTLTLGGAVTGTGSLQIDPNAELEIQGATGQTVNFNGPGGVLWLDQSATFSGTIGGLGAGDEIVLGNTAATAAVFNNGYLDITLAGNVHDLLKVTGGGAGLSLTMSLDNSGNTLLAVGQA